MKRENVTTSDGKFLVAGSGRVLVAALADLFLPATTLMSVFAVLEKIGVTLPELVTPITGVFVFMYVLLARRGAIFSIGNWGFGLRRYSFASIKGYSGTGTLFVLDNLPSSVTSRRTAIVVIYLGMMCYALSLLQSPN